MTVPGAILGALVLVEPAYAQSRGVYPLGMSAINSGVTPPSGFTYANQLLLYRRNQIRDDARQRLPVEGSNVVLMDLNTFAWVSPEHAGIRVSAAATLPIAKNSLTSDVSGPISGGAGFADSFYMPLIIAWANERAASRLFYGFLAPTGRFTDGASDNVGSGYWTHTAASGQTVHLVDDQKLTLSAFEMYELHTGQEGTGTRPGQTFDLDWSLLATVAHDDGYRVQAGLVGYEQWQTTATTGPRVTAEASRSRYNVNAVGLAGTAAFPTVRASVGLKGLQEFANRSTFQGYSLQVQGGISFLRCRGAVAVDHAVGRPGASCWMAIAIDASLPDHSTRCCGLGVARRASGYPATSDWTDRPGPRGRGTFSPVPVDGRPIRRPPSRGPHCPCEPAVYRPPPTNRGGPPWRYSSPRPRRPM